MVSKQSSLRDCHTQVRERLVITCEGVVLFGAWITLLVAFCKQFFK